MSYDTHVGFRVKERDLSQSPGWKLMRRTWTNGVPGPWNTPEYGSTLATKDVLKTYGYDLPHFHARVRKGELLPYTYFSQFYGKGSANATYNVKYLLGSGPNYLEHACLEGNFLNFSHTQWAVDDGDVEAALPTVDNYYVQQAAAAIYNSGHDTLTFLAELASVRRLFLATGKKILTLNFPRNWRTLSSDWLAWRYGWRTLGYDIESLSKAILNLNSERTRYTEKKGETTSNSYMGSNVVWTYQNATVTHEYSIVTKSGLNGCVTADIAVPQFQFNPIQTGWELIPFSFVVDWFVGVGKALSAGSFLANAKAYTASVGLYVEITKESFYRFRPSSTVWGTWIQTGSYVGRIERRIPCSVPQTPQYRVRLNSAKVADLVGLVLQRTKGGS